MCRLITPKAELFVNILSAQLVENNALEHVIRFDFLGRKMIDNSSQVMPSQTHVRTDINIDSLLEQHEDAKALLEELEI